MTFGAAYIRGLTGFGMAIILVPLFGLIVKPGEAVVIGILLQVCTHFFNTYLASHQTAC